MADEVTDLSNKEQFALALCYTTENNSVEQFYEYADCKNITGKSFCEIISMLEPAQLSVSDFRAHMYNGAENMAGQQRRCVARFH